MNNRKLKIKNFIIIPLLLFVLMGCKEEGRIDHIDGSAPAPAPIDAMSVNVRKTPGGAVLKYKLPEDISNLLYVRADYEIQSGVKRQTKASCYEDSLVLDGFGDTRTYDVLLYSIGKNEKSSKPVIVQVEPGVAPVYLATALLKEAFGGVAVVIENPEKAALAIELMGDTAKLGYQSRLATYYTSKEKANFTFRGLDTIQGDFSVYMRDRWNNMSETETATLTPWYEEFIPKDKWNADPPFPLPGDRAASAAAYQISNIWNGNITTESMYNAAIGGTMPIWITWDLGVTIVMSRFTYWYSPNRTPFAEYSLKEFELYGSTNPNLDGSWDSWTKLGKFECLRPSGLNINTAEDEAFARAGFEFELEETDVIKPFVPVRYIRLKGLSNFFPSGVGAMMIQEISIWGLIQE